MRHLKVHEMMTNLVVRLYPDDSIQHARSRLTQNDISGAPVVRDGKVVGVVSEVDLMKSELWAHVSRVMSTHVVTTSAESSVTEAAMLMQRHGINRLPVTDSDGFLIGIISRGDVVRAISDRGKQELEMSATART